MTGEILGDLSLLILVKGEYVTSFRRWVQESFWWLVKPGKMTKHAIC